MHYAVVKRAVHNQESRKAALDSRQRMVHDRVTASALNFEVDDGRAAGWYGHGLYAGQRWRAETGALVNMIEDFTDHVER